MSHKKNYWQFFGLSLAHSHPSSSTVYDHPEVYTALRAIVENGEDSIMENGKDSKDIQSTRSPLLELPNEILQNIATLLPNDWDIFKLALTCKETKARILGPEGSNASFWRTRFEQKYDMPQGRTPQEVMLEYQTRSIVLSPKIDLGRCSYEQMNFWLEVIQTMLHEALTLPLPVGATSKTYEQIREAVHRTKFLSRPKTKNKMKGIWRYMYTMQLCLTALALDPAVSPPGYRDDYNIASVYAFSGYFREFTEPFIQHGRLNILGLMEMRSFWARHLLSPVEGTFYNSFSSLAYDLKPKIRKTDGSNATDLSDSWIGYYSCLHPLPSSFRDERRQTCADLDSHWEQVDTLSLEIESQTNEPFWPAECEELIPRCGSPDIKRLYFYGHQNTLSASRDAANPMFGFVEPMEREHGELPGWCRICFAICEKTEGIEQSSWSSASSHWVHGYEAVIIPGGRLMLGWWIDMKNTSGRGPFIFWDV
ncbi:hypothetical protein N7451_005408 [Penicillium sp. IBT 35674x]|nr:hypothetical protein N7451_005408 [Penicillium sp. IBT 35674x]